jgi:hypothetical protein
VITPEHGRESRENAKAHVVWGLAMRRLIFALLLLAVCDSVRRFISRLFSD